MQRREIAGNQTIQTWNGKKKYDQYNDMIYRCFNCANNIIKNHIKLTQNRPKSVPISLKHVKHPKSIIICPILGIVVAFSALETYQSDLSTVTTLSARSNYHSCHLIMNIVESLSVRSWNYHINLITLKVLVDVIMINLINQSQSCSIYYIS